MDSIQREDDEAKAKFLQATTDSLVLQQSVQSCAMYDDKSDHSGSDDQPPNYGRYDACYVLYVDLNENLQALDP